MSAVASISKLTVRLGPNVVLDGVDLEIGSGEFVALLGGNGSGKTTLVRTLLRILEPSSGSISLFGQDLATFKAFKRIGYVPQRLSAPSSHPGTVEEVVASGAVAWPPKLFGSGFPRAHVVAALDSVDLADLRGRPVAELSGGQMQRVLIARALVTNPDLLILDEPVASVDVGHRVAFIESLEALGQTGRTIVMVTHSIEEVEAFATRALVLDGGRIVYDGPPDRTVPHEHHAHHDDAGSSSDVRLPRVGER